MSKSRTIILAASGATPSPEHKRFQTLLLKIEKARMQLGSWQDKLLLYGQAHQSQVQPLLQQLDQNRHRFALQLEQMQLGHKWSKADRASLSDLICSICADMLHSDGESDPEVKALYNRHATLDFDAEAKVHLEHLKSMVESVTGMDLGSDSAESFEDLMLRTKASMAEQQQQQEQEQAQDQAREAARRRKPPRQTAAQKRAEEDQRRSSQTVREVYRKLASALHPDRLPADMPAADRQQVIERMQRANAAYEAGDLLTLLELQLQIEQVDLAHASRMAAEQVRHLNKVLAGQLRELEAEIDGRQHAFCATYGVQTYRRLDPEKLNDLLQDEVKHLLAAQHELAHDRQLLDNNPAMVKKFLKQWRAQQRDPDWDLGF